MRDLEGQAKDLQQKLDDDDRLANVEELITSAKQFSGIDGNRSTRDFLEQITLASDTDQYDESQDRVSVMTIHASKGLEFPVVYILAMEQGILPGERSLEHKEDLKEERRVAFVAMTRAKKELYLCHTRMREFRGQTLYAIPSMFLEELPDEVEQMDLSAHGGRIPSHDNYRSGGRTSNIDWAFAPATAFTELLTDLCSSEQICNGPINVRIICDDECLVVDRDWQL